MANRYIYSGAAGSNNGTSWANAYTKLETAFGGDVAGDNLFMAHDHAETTAANIFLASAGTLANPVKIICVDRGGSVPPVSADRRATAQVTTTGASSISFTGTSHFDGIIFNAGTSTSVAHIQLTNDNFRAQRFDNCSLRIVNTAATSQIQMGTSTVGGVLVELNNTTMSFGAVGQTVGLQGKLVWRDTPSALLGTIPTILFTPVSLRGATVECSGVDLSAAGSGKTICGTLTTCNPVSYSFSDCKLDASVTKSAVPGAPGSNDVDFIRSGSSGVNYNVFRHRVTGTLNEETTIVRTGGATDGTTAIAWKIDTTANCTYSYPFECPPIAIWNDTTGSSVTATVEGIWGGGAVPLDSEIWLECEFLGDASSPLGSFVADCAADLLTAGANQTSSSETWGGSTTKFKLSVSFVAQQRGWVYARVKCAKASSVFYIDPLVVLS